MNNLNEFRVAKSAIVDIATWLSCGFEKIAEDSESVTLRLPQSWFFVDSEKNGMMYFKDQKGNVRGSVHFLHANLTCRYVLVLVSIPKHYSDEDNHKLLLRDNKTGNILMNFGTCEPYSDYEKDLVELARKALKLKYPDSDNPLAYWEE